MFGGWVQTVAVCAVLITVIAAVFVIVDNHLARKHELKKKRMEQDHQLVTGEDHD